MHSTPDKGVVQVPAPKKKAPLYLDGTQSKTTTTASTNSLHSRGAISGSTKSIQS